MTSRDRFLTPVPATPRPMFVRGTYLSEMVQQLNRNTVRLAWPRSKVEDAVITSEAAADPVTLWVETSKVTETVRVENPDDSEQYVNVERRTLSSFTAPDGQTMTLAFDNT